MIDVFKIGVHIGMTTNSSKVLSVMLRELTGVHIAAGRVNGALAQIRAAALAAGAIFVGWEVGKGLMAAVKHAERLNHELTKLKIGAGLTAEQTNAASNSAFATANNVPGSHVHENVKMTRELFGVFGNMEEADRLTPLVAEGSLAVRNFTDVQGVDLAKIAIKALELRGHITKDGKIDEKEFAQEFNSMVRAIVASEGLVDPQKLYMAISQAGPAARAMNGEEFWGKFPAIMNGLGASKSGTALMSLFSQFVGHVVAGDRVAIAMQRAGMLKPGSWHNGRGGKIIMDPDAVPDQAGFMDHPLTWLHDHIDAIRNQKDANGKPIDSVAVIQELFQLNSRVTTLRLMSDLDANWPVIMAEEARFRRMPSIHDIRHTQLDNDYSANLQAMSAAWDNFMTALGKPGISVAIQAMQGITATLNAMQAAIIKHPTIAKDLFYFAGAMSALFVLGGSIRLFAIVLSPFATALRLLVAVPGLAGAGAALSSLGVGIGSLVAPVALLIALLSARDYLHDKLGFGNPDGFTPLGGGPGQGVPRANPLSPLLQLRKEHPEIAPMPGDEDFKASPYVPRPGGHNAPTKSPVYLDGKKVGSIMEEYFADRFARSLPGSVNSDLRMTPGMPGLPWSMP